MSTTTGRYGWPVPEEGDAADGAAQIAALAAAIESTVGSIQDSFKLPGIAMGRLQGGGSGKTSVACGFSPRWVEFTCPWGTAAGASPHQADLNVGAAVLDSTGHIHQFFTGMRSSDVIDASADMNWTTTKNGSGDVTSIDTITADITAAGQAYRQTRYDICVGFVHDDTTVYGAGALDSFDTLGFTIQWLNNTPGFTCVWRAHQ